MGLLIEGSIFYQLWAGVNARRTVQASAAALPAKPGVCDGCFRSCNTWRLALPRGHIRVRRLGTIARTSPRRGLCPYQRADRGMANSQSGHRPVAEVTDAQRESGQAPFRDRTRVCRATYSNLVYLMISARECR